MTSDISSYIQHPVLSVLASHWHCRCFQRARDTGPSRYWCLALPVTQKGRASNTHRGFQKCSQQICIHMYNSDVLYIYIYTVSFQTLQICRVQTKTLGLAVIMLKTLGLSQKTRVFLQTVRIRYSACFQHFSYFASSCFLDFPPFSLTVRKLHLHIHLK